MFLCFWRDSPQWARTSSFTSFRDHTHQRTTIGSDQLVAETATWHHNTHHRQTSMPRVGFEPTISAGEQPQTHALNRAASGTGTLYIHADPKFSYKEASFNCCRQSETSVTFVHVRKTAVNWTHAFEKVTILGRSFNSFNYHEKRTTFSNCAQYKIHNMHYILLCSFIPNSSHSNNHLLRRPWDACRVQLVLHVVVMFTQNEFSQQILIKYVGINVVKNCWAVLG
jgi:hypothetical protein